MMGKCRFRFEDLRDINWIYLALPMGDSQKLASY